MIFGQSVRSLLRAREVLDEACRDLQDALVVLTHDSNDNVMATPHVVALMDRVTLAKRDVTVLEGLPPPRTDVDPGSASRS